MVEKPDGDVGGLDWIVEQVGVKGVKTEKFLAQLDGNVDLERVNNNLQVLIDSGLLLKRLGRYQLSRRLDLTVPISDQVTEVLRAKEMVEKSGEGQGHSKNSWHESYAGIHDFSRGRLVVESLRKQDQNQVLFISEINLGYRWTDPTILQRIIEVYGAKEQKERPQVIVVGGLIYGEFRYQRKPLQDNVVFELNEQFKQAHDLLSDIAKLGTRVIVNASDKEVGRYGSVATQMAADVYFSLKKMAKPAMVASTNESTFDQLYKDELFAELRDAARNLFVPYCIAAGRTLRDGNEMSKATSGACRTHEGALLLEAFRKMHLEQKYDSRFLDAQAIPGLDGKVLSGWQYVDDHQLSMLLGKEEVMSMDVKRRTGNVSDVTLRTDVQGGLRNLLRGAEEPENLHFGVELSQHQLLVSQEGYEDYAVTTPGFTDAARLRQAQGTYANSADMAYRMQYIRKRNGVPGTVAIRRNSDRSIEFEVATRNLIEKRHGKPTIVVQWNDWQIESDTQRPDVALSTMTRLQDLLLNAPDGLSIELIINGDMKQGHNFRGKAQAEPASRGGIDHQDAFLLELLQTSFGHFGLDNESTRKKFVKALKKLEKVVILPGNHCWNSGFRDYGAVHNRFLKDFFEKLFLSAGIRPEDRVIAPDRVYSDKGDFYYWWMHNGKAAGYQVMAQHDILEKGGGSGSKDASSGPIMQVNTQLEGLRDDMDIDFDLRGHWHRFQMATFPRVRLGRMRKAYTDGVVAVIAPSLAGGSTYEHRRGLHSFIGQVELHLGGGHLPIVRLNTHHTLASYDIKHGYFTSENLRRLGFETDAEFDVLASGFYGAEGRMSDRQKAVHDLRNRVVGTEVRGKTATRLGRWEGRE